MFFLNFHDWNDLSEKDLEFYDCIFVSLKLGLFLVFVHIEVKPVFLKNLHWSLLYQAVQDFLNDRSSPSLAHLGSIATNLNWTDTEIQARHKSMLMNVWNTLYGKWLNP